MKRIKNAGAALSMAFMVAALVTACGGGGGGTAVGSGTAPVTAVNFSNGQAASAVIGQMDFVSGNSNQGGAVAANTMNNSYAEPFVDAGKLYLPDENNNRTLVYNSIPTTNGANADFAIGQPDLISNAGGTSATAVSCPEHLVIANGKLIQADYCNHRVVIYNAVPTSGPGTIDVVVGQANKTSSASTCDASTLFWPESVVTANGKLIVTDGGHNRVLIWNSIPTTDGVPADVVLGQADFTSCNRNGASATVAANTLSDPAGMWSDGTRLAVVDYSNSRVLIWNSIPASNNQPADLVLGQPDFTSSLSNQGLAAPTAATMSYPYDGVFFNGAQFFVGDFSNNRVLVWNSFPTANGQAADVVLGQPDFTSNTGGTSATVMNGPTGMFLYGKQLIVSDTNNSRYLIFNGQ